MCNRNCCCWPTNRAFILYVFVYMSLFVVLSSPKSRSSSQPAAVHNEDGKFEEPLLQGLAQWSRKRRFVAFFYSAQSWKCVDRATSFYSSVRLSFLISLLIKVTLDHRDVLKSIKLTAIVFNKNWLFHRLSFIIHQILYYSIYKSVAQIINFSSNVLFNDLFNYLLCSGLLLS